MTLAQLAGGSIASTAVTAVLGSSLSALAVLLVAARPWSHRSGHRSSGRSATAAWGPPLAVASAFLVGYVLVLGVPEFPPERARAWLFFAALATAGLGVATGNPASGKHRLGTGFLWAVVWLLPWVMLEFQRANHWGRLEGFLWTNALALVSAVALGLFRAHERSRSSPSGAFGLALALALCAGAYGLAGSSGTAQLTGILAVAVGLCALLGWWRSAAGLGAGGSAVAVPLHFGLLWCARYLAELHTASFVLLSLVPIAVWAARAIPAPRSRTRALVTALAPTLLGAAALWIEFRGAPAPAPYG